MQEWSPVLDDLFFRLGAFARGDMGSRAGLICNGMSRWADTYLVGHRSVV